MNILRVDEFWTRAQAVCNSVGEKQFVLYY